MKIYLWATVNKTVANHIGKQWSWILWSHIIMPSIPTIPQLLKYLKRLEENTVIPGNSYGQRQSMATSPNGFTHPCVQF